MSRRRDTRRAAARMETFKAASSKLEGRRVSGRAITYLSPIDAAEPTVMAPGAFTKSIREQSKRIKFLAHHDPQRPIGRVIELRDTPDALYFVAELDETREADDILSSMRAGTLDGVSVGFDPLKVDYVRPEQLLERGAQDSTVQRYLKEGTKSVRLILEGRLWECSATTWGADPLALVDRVGFRLSREEREERERVARLRVRRIELDLEAARAGIFLGGGR